MSTQQSSNTVSVAELTKLLEMLIENGLYEMPVYISVPMPDETSVMFSIADLGYINIKSGDILGNALVLKGATESAFKLSKIEVQDGV